LMQMNLVHQLRANKSLLREFPRLFSIRSA
jgi:hypothetical protein